MIAVLTGPDAVVIAAALTAIPAGLAWWNSRTAAKATKPNGGGSLHDIVTRIESAVGLVKDKVDDEIMPRLDRGASRLAEHDDRLAVLEATRPLSDRGGHP